MLSVTKIFEFAYAHSLPDYPGKCKDLHGHNCVLEIEVTDSPVDFKSGYNGMVIDFGELKNIVDREVIDKLNHTYLNRVISVPTAENMVAWIKNRLVGFFGNGLVRIRVYETSTSYAEWKRDG